MPYQFDVFVPEQGMTEAGHSLSLMLADESVGKSYADVMRLRVSGIMAEQCCDVYFVARDGDTCISRLWNGWGKHKDAIGNFGNFLTLEDYRGQGVGTQLLEMWYADLQSRVQQPLALFCTSAPRAARMYEKYGMRPIRKGESYGPSFLPLGDSPRDFDAFCKAYYQPSPTLIAKPATFAYRHEIDLLLKFARMQKGLPFGFAAMPCVEQALLSAPEKTEMLFDERGRCVGWRFDGAVQVYPDYKDSIIKTI